MQRVNKHSKPSIRQAAMASAVLLASLGADASVTVTSASYAGSPTFISGSQFTYQLAPEYVFTPIELAPTSLPGTAFASSAVSGSLYYSSTTGSGNFSENDFGDGTPVSIELERKGFAYRSGASAEAGMARATASTQTAPDVYGYSSAAADSSWTDWFVITGGSGVSTASFSSLLTGSLASGRAGSAGYGISLVYSTGSTCYYWYNTCSEADQTQTLFSQTGSMTGRGSSTLSQTIEGEFVFEYDKPFKLTASLNANASNGGSADLMLSSLASGLLLPVNSMVSSASGVYVQAVPEAETWTMLLAGLGLVGWAARRRVA